MNRQGEDQIAVQLLVAGGVLAVGWATWWLIGDRVLVWLAMFSVAASWPWAVVDRLLGEIGIGVPFLDAWLLTPSGTLHERPDMLDPDFLHRNALAIMVIGGRGVALPAVVLLLVMAVHAVRLRSDHIYRRFMSLDEAIGEHGNTWSPSRRARLQSPVREEETAVDSERWRLVETMCEKHHHERGVMPPSGSWLLMPIPDPVVPPPSGRALRPEEWLDSLCLRDRRGSPVGVGNMVGGVTTVSMTGIAQALASQLTVPWSGIGCLTGPQQALCASLGLIAGGERAEAELLIDELATVTAGGTTVVNAMCNNRALAERVRMALDVYREKLTAMTRKHYWRETAIAEAWDASRAGRGVWPSARFLWLKSEDRQLWYVISGMGGTAVPVEAAGVLGHHLAEKRYGMALLVPHMHHVARSMHDHYFDLAHGDRRQAGSTTTGDRLQEVIPGDRRKNGEHNGEG